jgi:hypothetical protein
VRVVYYVMPLLNADLRSFFWVVDYPFGFWISLGLGLGLDLNFHPSKYLGWIWVLSLGCGLGCPDITSDPSPTH